MKACGILVVKYSTVWSDITVKLKRNTFIYFVYRSHFITFPGGGSRGRVQGVRTPPPPEMTCSFIIELVFCKKRKLCGLLVLKQSKRRVHPFLKKILNPPLSLDVFLVALWFVVAASCLHVVKGRRKQCPGVKVCFLVMLRSSLSYNKVIKMFFSFGWQKKLGYCI